MVHLVFQPPDTIGSYQHSVNYGFVEMKNFYHKKSLGKRGVMERTIEIKTKLGECRCGEPTKPVAELYTLATHKLISAEACGKRHDRDEYLTAAKYYVETAAHILRELGRDTAHLEEVVIAIDKLLEPPVRNEHKQRIYNAVLKRTPNPKKLPPHPKKIKYKKFDTIVEYRKR